jgi:hypothetical protein
VKDFGYTATWPQIPLAFTVTTPAWEVTIISMASGGWKKYWMVGEHIRIATLFSK